MSEKSGAFCVYTVLEKNNVLSRRYMYHLTLVSNAEGGSARVSPAAKPSLSVLVRPDAEKLSINGDGERFL